MCGFLHGKPHAVRWLHQTPQEIRGLFDIDGTLLHAHGGVHYDAFCSSVLAVMGHSLSIDAVPCS
jgi:hypothetical protein